MHRLFCHSRWILAVVLLTALFTSLISCQTQPVTTVDNVDKTVIEKTVPHEAAWGIYQLDLATSEVQLLYSTQNEIYSSALRLNSTGDKLVFAQKADGTADNDCEIFSISVDGSNLSRVTSNNFWDLYPVWSPDGSKIAFLSKREGDLDIYVINSDGSNEKKLFDSGDNDADIDWAGENIVFTSQFAIWKMRADGTGATMITELDGRGEWGSANLPEGDYDPRLSNDGRYIVFERLEDTNKPNGGYNLFTINIDGTGETRLTDDSYAQGIASWSHSGDKIVYIVAAIDGAGKYDIYVINSDGTDNHDITPGYFPPAFLCHSPVFSINDDKVFFIGQWWQ
jgi:Tol biopolymer transport system component